MSISHKIHNSTIRVKLGFCSLCDNNVPVPLIGGKCQNHYWKSRRKSEEKKSKKPIKKLSEKRAKQTAKYLRARLEYLNENPYCERCGASATDLHHKMGRREELIYDKKYFMSACRRCHDWIHTNDAEARDQGYLLNRI